jgi:PAP2 superfamily
VKPLWIQLETLGRWLQAQRWQGWKSVRILIPVALVAFFLIWRVFLTPDVMFAFLFVVFVTYGLAFEFIKLFSPFVALLLSYDSLRGFIPYISKHVHYSTMIDFDDFVGNGQLPTVWLQHLLYHGSLRWYDFYFYGLYMLHFVVPVLFAVLVWRTRPQQYWRYVWSFVTVSYAGFITFLLFPAAPPWLAAQNGYIPHIEKLSTDIWWAFGVHDFPTLYAKFTPNPVAAVPSLHSAYPMLVALFVWKLYGRKWGLISFLYPLSVWLGVVYMGEHYLFDVVGGVTYAIVSFVVVDWLMDRRRRRQADHRRPAIVVPA